jgi:NTE family protein
MGAIVGGLYAIGYSPSEIQDIISNADWDRLFSGSAERTELSMQLKQYDGRYTVALPVQNKHIRLPSGLVSDYRVFILLSRLTVPAHDIHDFSQLAIPFACIATDIATGQAITLNSGSLAEAMRASMSLPSIFPPTEYQGRLLVDGGLARNLPVSDVMDMGADRVIAVDVSAPLKKKGEIRTFLDVLNQSSSFQAAASNEVERGKANILISPDITGISLVSLAEADNIIERGEEAALAALPAIQALVDSVGSKAFADRRLPLMSGAFPIGSVEIEGLSALRPSVVLSQLDLALPGAYTLDDLDEAMERIYSIKSFQYVRYELNKMAGGYRLVVRLKEKSENLLRLALRYDSNLDASLLVNTFIRNLGQQSSFLNLDVKLGNNLVIDGNYFYHTGWFNTIGLATRAQYSKLTVNLFEAASRTAQVNVRASSWESTIGSIFSTKLLFTVGLKLERASIGERIASAQDSLRYRDTVLPVTNIIWWDTLNRRYFPTRGLSVYVRNELATKHVVSPASFTRHYFDVTGYIPVGQRFSLMTKILLAGKSGDPLPPHYRFVLGGIDTQAMMTVSDQGMVSFYGTRYQELTGQYLQLFQAGIQVEIYPQVFLSLTGNAGNAFESWSSSAEGGRLKRGLGVTLGADTPLGPVEITGMTGSDHTFRSNINIGLKF